MIARAVYFLGTRNQTATAAMVAPTRPRLVASSQRVLSALSSANKFGLATSAGGICSLSLARCSSYEWESAAEAAPFGLVAEGIACGRWWGDSALESSGRVIEKSP